MLISRTLVHPLASIPTSSLRGRATLQPEGGIGGRVGLLFSHELACMASRSFGFVEVHRKAAGRKKLGMGWTCCLAIRPPAHRYSTLDAKGEYEGEVAGGWNILADPCSGRDVVFQSILPSRCRLALTSADWSSRTSSPAPHGNDGIAEQGTIECHSPDPAGRGIQPAVFEDGYLGHI